MDASEEQEARSAGYWYTTTVGAPAEAVDVLNELRRYRESTTTLRSKVRQDMGMGEKDLLALRMLLAARSRGEVMRQQDLARRLAITAASTSALVDRLVRDGCASREAHPEDRRSIAVVPTAHAEREVRDTLQDMHRRMLAVAEALSPEERAVVNRFLRDLNHSIDAEPGTR